jgi:predicted RNA-binding protein with PUA-like domain
MGRQNQFSVNCALRASALAGRQEEAMAARHWLIKSEPAAYSWDDLVKDGETLWDGIRNHRAANNLRAMNNGDRAFFYHSVSGKEIVGIAEVSEAGLADPKDAAWAAARIKPVRPLERPVTLAEIKADPALAEIELVRLSRLSVAQIRPAEWDRICSLAKT